MESQLRRGAAFCRRMAAGVLVLAVAGSVAIAAAFGGGDYGGGISAQVVLVTVFVSMLGLGLALVLLLGVSRTMNGLADLLARTGRLEAGVSRPARARVGDPRGNGGRRVSLQGPGAAAPAPAAAQAVIGQVVLIGEVTEHVRWGHFVKVTTADGLTGWVRDTDLPLPGSPSPTGAAAAAPAANSEGRPG